MKTNHNNLRENLTVILVMALSLSIMSFLVYKFTGRRAKETKVLKLGYVMAPVGAAHEAAIKFAELLSLKTDGVLTVKLFPGAALGNDRELAEGLTLGSVDLVLSGLASISWYVPQYEVLEAPFVFRDYEHLDRVVHGAIGKEVEAALLEAKGIRILDWWFRGPRYLTTNREITSVSDLKGMKLRVPELPTYIESWKILGTNPTPITYSEMFMALKQQTVEGQENPLEVIYTNSLFEVQKYVTETRHLLGTFLMMTGEDLYLRLNDDERRALNEAALEAGQYEYERMLSYEEDYLEKLRDKGMIINAIDISDFRKLVIRELPGRFKDRWEPGLFERIQAAEPRQ